MDDVFLVIAATDDRELNQRVFAAANARYRPVNVVDDQQLCSFVFPSIVDRSPLLVAISSSGKAPVLSRILREKKSKRYCPQIWGDWPKRRATGAII